MYVKKIKVINGNYNIYCDAVESFGGPKLKYINTDCNGVIQYEYPDSLEGFYWYESGISYYDKDSIYFFSYLNNSDSVMVDVYNDSLKFNRRIILDTSDIEYSLLKRIPPSAGILSKDNYIITSISGPDVYWINETKYSVLCKFDLSGKIIKYLKIENENYIRTKVTNIIETKNGEYILWGILYTANSYDLMFAKININFELQFTKTFTFNDPFSFRGFEELKDGKYFAIYGYRKDKNNSNNKMYSLLIINDKGDIINDYVWQFNNDNVLYGISEQANGNLIIYGRHGWNRVYLAEIEFSPLSNDDNYNINNSKVNLSIYPSIIYNIQFSNINFSLKYKSKINIQLINNIGNKITDIFSGYKESGSHTIQFNQPPGLAVGLYWIRMIIDGNEQIVKPIVIIK